MNNLSGVKRVQLLLVVIAGVVVVFLADWLVWPTVLLVPFYVIPIVVGAWLLGPEIGVSVAVLASILALAAEFQPQLSPEERFFNVGGRLVVGASFAVLTGLLRREQLRLREVLRRTEADRDRVRQFMATLDDPVLMVDAAGVVGELNASANALFGAQAIGRPAAKSLPPQGRPGSEYIRWGGQITDQFGASIAVDVYFVPLADPMVSREGAYVVHDVTRHADLGRMREQLLFTVAHELRGPLGVLENAVELLASEAADMSAQEHARVASVALRTAKRLRTLMEDLLSAGGIQAGRLTIAPAPVAVRTVIDDAFETVQPEMAEREQSLQIDAADGIEIQADRRYVRQVLTNLLSNASRYAPRATPVTLSAERVDGEVRIAVQDRGPGIAPDQVSGLFERFYRIRRDSAEPGIGLGLAISKGIVEAHGGRIGVDTEPGRGTTVWFTLPVAQAAVVA